MVGENIKKIIKEKGFKQGDFASILGMSYQNLHLIFQKEYIKPKQLKEIAEKLDVPVEYIKNYRDKITSEANEPLPEYAKGESIEKLQKENKFLLEMVGHLKKEAERYGAIIDSKLLDFNHQSKAG